MQTHIKAFSSIAAFLSIALSSTASANLTAGSVMTDIGAEITPTLQTGVSSNSNFFSTPNNEESRLIWTIEPNLKAVIEDGPDSYKLNLGTSSALHNKESLDNYTQVDIDAAIHKEFTSQHRLDLTGDAKWLYESRGLGLTEGLGDAVNELVKYQLQNVSARYEYGAQSSKALIAFEGGYFRKKYQNFREISRYRDYDKSLLGITGYYNTQAATRIFVEFKQENYDYDVLANSGFSRDSTDLKVLAGMQWKATAITCSTSEILSPESVTLPKNG